MTILSLLLLVMIIGWLALITVWRLQGRSAIESLFAEAKDLTSKHSSVLNAIYFVMTFIALVCLSVMAISQIGGRQSFFSDESFNNGENIIAYYDFLVGLPLSVVTSFIAILLAWNALRISTRQQKAEEFSLYLALFESHKHDFGIFLKDFLELNENTQAIMEKLTNAAKESSDYREAGRITELDVGSLIVLSNTNSVDGFFRQVETQNAKKTNSPKWNEFINNLLNSVEENFWYEDIDEKLLEILVEIVKSKRNGYDYAVEPLEDYGVNRTSTLLSTMSGMSRHGGITGGGLRHDLQIEQVADGEFMDALEYVEHLYPGHLYPEKGPAKRTKLEEQLLTVSSTDRLFLCPDDDTAFVKNEKGADGETYTAWHYDKYKLIRVSGFDTYVVCKTLVTPNLVQHYNSLIEKYDEFDLIFSDWFAQTEQSPEKGLTKIATEVLRRKQKDMREKMFSRVEKMAELLNLVVSSKNSILIEAGSVDKQGVFSKSCSETLEYEFGFSTRACELIKNPMLVFEKAE